MKSNNFIFKAIAGRKAVRLSCCLHLVIRSRGHETGIGVGIRRREFLNQWATPAYRRTHVGQQFVEMFEMVGRDA